MVRETLAGAALEGLDHRSRHTGIGQQVADGHAGRAFGGGMPAERLGATVPSDLAAMVGQGELAPGELGVATVIRSSAAPAARPSAISSSARGPAAGR